jgi:hypothetical protein
MIQATRLILKGFAGSDGVSAVNQDCGVYQIGEV